MRAQRADGNLVAIARPFLGTQLGGDIVEINAQGFVEIHQPATPGGAAGTAQTSATNLGVTTDAKCLPLGGRFASVYPLYDGTNRMLVSWSPCLVLDTTVTPNATNLCTAANTAGANVTLAPPQYTLWVYNMDAGTLGPLLSADVGTMVIEPIILQPRKPAPTILVDAAPLPGQAETMATAGVGLLDISSVYDVDGIDTATPNIAGVSNPANPTFYTRPYRFIRIEKAVEIPGKTVRKINQSAFGPAGMGMREILGYAPIQPDGSVEVQVPANVPFTIDIVDVNAKRVTAQHSSWLQLLPGETKKCNGCHTTVNMTLARPRRLDEPGQSGRADHRLAVPEYQSGHCPHQRRRDDGGDPRAQHLHGKWQDPERRGHAVLADLEHGRDLRRHLDGRHHAAATRYAVLVHLRGRRGPQ